MNSDQSHPAAFVARKTTQNTRDRAGERSRARAENHELLKRAKDLLDLIEEKDKSAAVRTLRAGLKASRRVFIGKGKGWTKEPDYRVRHESAMAILAYAYGKPIERQIVASGTFQELSEILTRMSASPMAMKKLPHLVPRHEQDREKP